MACAWTNKRNAVEVCSNGYIYPLGSYVYVGYQDPNYSLIEVAQNLSSYTVTPLPSMSNSTLYSKRQRVYSAKYSQSSSPNTMSVSRYDGAGVFTPISEVPTGLAALSWRIQYTAGKLRAINSATGFIDSLYESEDGEVWAVRPGSVTFTDTAATKLTDYTDLGSRLIGARSGTLSGGSTRLAYSDNAGATWVNGAGSAVSGSNSFSTEFTQSGSNIIAYAKELYVGSDGATWTQYSGLSKQFYNTDVHTSLAASGSGAVVVFGSRVSDSEPGIAYSSNHGGSWTLSTWAAAGIPGLWADVSMGGLFWSGTQFVVFVKRADLSRFQIYTSATGASWTGGMIIPIPPTTILRGTTVQIID